MQGYIRGTVNGVVEGNFTGIVRGDMEALIISGKAVPLADTQDRENDGDLSSADDSEKLTDKSVTEGSHE